MKNEHIQKNITGLLEKIGFQEKEIEVTFDEGMNTLWFSITSPQTRLLLSREAEALGALNHIVSRMVEQMSKADEKHPHVVIDANNFEKKKIENLKTVAHMMAERARYFKASVDVEPMTPHDRRVIHEFLSALPDVTTESVGEGMKRHIVVKYTGSI